jgi:excisionase family DNA binding protein
MPEKRWVSVPECALYLGLHVSTIRRMVAIGEIPASRLRGRKNRSVIRVDLLDLNKKLESSKGPEKKKI